MLKNKNIKNTESKLSTMYSKKLNSTKSYFISLGLKGQAVLESHHVLKYMLTVYPLLITVL